MTLPVKLSSFAKERLSSFEALRILPFTFVVVLHVKAPVNIVISMGD